MLSNKPYMRVLRYIVVTSALLLLMASDCDYGLRTPSKPPEGGIVRRDPESGSIRHGNLVALTAVPNEGFVFSHWEPGGEESPILSFKMPGGDRTRTAVFEPFDPSLGVSQPPQVTIFSPTRSDATLFENAERILFSGTVVDPEDGSLTGESLVWASSIDGQIGTGESFSAILSTGRHTITLTGTDSQQVEGVDAVVAIVNPPFNASPTGDIINPASGDKFLTTDAIHFSGTGSDPEDGALTGESLVWTSSIDGDLGTGESLDATLSEGNHRIRLTISDSQQRRSVKANNIVVKLRVNQAPLGSIISPEFGESISILLTTDSIDFRGVFIDPEDGPLTGDSLMWASDVDGELGIGESFSASLSAGYHDITLKAKDSEGLVVTDYARVQVHTPPTVTITSPAEGDTFLPGDSISFRGSADDLEDGALTGASLVWGSHLDGLLGTGGSITATASLGQHTVTLIATDSQGGVGTGSLSITVAPPPNVPPTASIESPVFGETFRTDEDITFYGIGNDAEEGLLKGASLVWTSDIDGEVGTGDAFIGSLTDLASDDALDRWMMREAHTYSHISCTCKMGPATDPMAVTGQYGKVHGMEGLRIVDASIMPDLVRAPINPTVLMIGERIADVIS